jgi:hypothetical protein
MHVIPVETLTIQTRMAMNMRGQKRILVAPFDKLR